MTRTKIILLILLLLLTFTLIALTWIQPEKGPHGGEVKVAGSYRIELKIEYPFLYAYLLDNKSVPYTNKGITCRLKCMFPDDVDARLTLKPYGEDGFFLRLGTMALNSYDIYFEVGSQTVSAEFNNQNITVRENDPKAVMTR